MKRLFKLFSRRTQRNLPQTASESALDVHNHDDQTLPRLRRSINVVQASGDIAVQESQANLENALAIPVEPKQPIRADLTFTEHVNEEKKQLVPASLETFLRLRSDLDLTGKVQQISIIHQSMGGYSDVYTGDCDCGDGVQSKVAIKKLRAHIQNNRSFEKDLVKEMYIWSKLDHPRILRFEGFFLEHDEYPLLVSKWMENGTALDYIQSNPEVDLVHLCLGVAEGLNYLHSEGVIHSDVKPGNILMSQLGEPVLCDFGLSRRLVASQTFQFSASQTGAANGTLRYMTKELLFADAKPSEKSDVWAFGMTILSLLTRKPPYAEKNDAQVNFAIYQIELPSQPAEFDSWSIQYESLWYIATFCWRNEPFRPLISVIASGLEYLHFELGATARHPISKQEAYSQALKSISKFHRSIRDLVREDPSGNFLRVYVDAGMNVKETIFAELRTTEAPCFTASNKPVYFASSEVDGSIVPGKFSEVWPMPFRVAYGHKEHEVASGTVLKFDPELMELVETSQGDVPEGRIPVIGGKELDGTVLHHAIAEVEGLRIPGKAGKHVGGAKIGQGWEHLRSKYQLLCWKM